MQPTRLMVSSKKGHCFSKRGIYYEKYCWRSRRHFEPIDTDADLGLFLSARLHRCTCRTFMPEEYRYLPIPLIVLVIGSMIVELALIYRQELSVYFRSNNKEK